MNRIKKINFKLIGGIFYWIVLIVLLFVAGLTAISALNIPGNYKLFTVLSGSMEPTIKTGSIVIIKPQDNYKKGDIITFQDLNKPKTTITHRLQEIKKGETETVFITKGDANKAPDVNHITKKQILGKTLFSVPYIGFPVNFAKTKEGLILLIIVPAIIIIYSELMNIKNETIRLLKERKERKLTAKEKVEVAIGKEEIAAEKGIKKLWRKLKIPSFVKSSEGKGK